MSSAVPIQVARILIRLLPVPLGWRLAVFLASLARRLPLDDRATAAVASARILHWGGQGRHVALCWGQGPLVLLLHGWGGRATQMAALGQHLAELGFCAVAPDFGAHGASPGRRIRFRRLMDEIGLLARQLGQPFYGAIGHSAGGLAMMAARAHGALRARRYVCISAPHAPYPPIAAMRRLLAPREAVLQRCRAFYEAEFRLAPGAFERDDAFRGSGEDALLLIYDRDDDQVDHADAERIARVWPAAQIAKTRGLGHHRVLWNAEVHRMVVDFLRCSAPRAAGESPRLTASVPA